MIGSDCIRVTTLVAVDPATAFAIFTEEVDAWWQKGPRSRFHAQRDGELRFEPGAGGRLVEVFDEAGGDVYEVGRILAWEPGARLVFEFRARAFGPGDCTEVEVRFEPEAGATRVTVEHRGWEKLPPDHPVRHGLVGPAFDDMMGVWWADLLAGLRRRAAGRGT